MANVDFCRCVVSCNIFSVYVTIFFAAPHSSTTAPRCVILEGAILATGEPNRSCQLRRYYSSFSGLVAALYTSRGYRDDMYV